MPFTLAISCSNKVGKENGISTIFQLLSVLNYELLNHLVSHVIPVIADSHDALYKLHELHSLNLVEKDSHKHKHSPFRLSSLSLTFYNNYIKNY